MYILEDITGMPRIARLDTPGLLHHVMIRGIEGRKIFNDDTDRENLIKKRGQANNDMCSAS